MFPVISIVGWHDVGKTTLAERLIAALTQRGYRVAAIKHSQGHFQLDQPGTDTARFAAAGAAMVGISSDINAALFSYGQGWGGLDDQLARLPSDLDLVIAEGFKRESAPKVEVTRAGYKADPIAAPEQLLALIGDTPERSDAPGVPRLAAEDTEGLIAILHARGLLTPRAAVSPTSLG